jgi:hypothetical protein
VKSNHNKNRKFLEINDKLIFSFKASSNRLMFQITSFHYEKQRKSIKRGSRLKFTKPYIFSVSPSMLESCINLIFPIKWILEES